MIRHFYLYVDESGDFDRDLNVDWKHECLIGGLLTTGKEPLKEKRAQAILVNVWKKIFPDDRSISETEILKKIRHSTELEENKASIVAEVLKEASTCGEFVIFQNYHKTRIINSTMTYINIMADGIVQLLGRLSMEYPNDSIQLHVEAGFRKDTTGVVTSDFTSGYISKEDCMERIREHMILLRMKNSRVVTSKSNVDFVFKDDKRVCTLVLADYICNFYFTSIAKIFRAEYKEGLSYKEYLLQYYDEKNIFSLNGNDERERLMAYMNVQDYDTALYEISTGLIQQEENIELLLTAFVQLPERVQKNSLQSFDNYINNIVAGERRIDDEVLLILDKGMQLIRAILERGNADVHVTYFSFLLYKLAVYNHRGDLDQMEKLFEEGSNYIGKLSNRTECLDYVFMFYNRYAVYMIDNFRIQEAYNLLEKVKETFEGLELALGLLPYMQNAAENMQSEQLGKILGTQAQCSRYLMARGSVEYEEAAKISDKAIRNLKMESDRERQYQYRVQIETEAGHREKAWEYMKKGAGFEQKNELFEGRTGNDFSLYHLSAYIKKFSKEECCHKEMKDLLERCDRIFRKQEVFDEFPSFVTIGNLAGAMCSMGYPHEKIKSYYRNATACTENTEAFFCLLKLCIQSEFASWLLKNQDAEALKVLNEMRGKCENLLKLPKEKLSSGVRAMGEKLKDILNGTAEADKLWEYANLRQY